MGKYGHKLSEYMKLNDKKVDKRTKQYKKKVGFTLYANNRLKVPDPWITEEEKECIVNGCRSI